MLPDRDFSFPLPRPLKKKKKSTCLAPHTVLMKHQGQPCTMSSLGSSTAHFSFLEPIPAMGPGNSFCYLLDKQTKVLVLFPITSGQLHCFVGLSPSTLNTLYMFSRNPYISCCQEVALLLIPRLVKLPTTFTGLNAQHYSDYSRGMLPKRQASSKRAELSLLQVGYVHSDFGPSPGAQHIQLTLAGEDLLWHTCLGSS